MSRLARAAPPLLGLLAAGLFLTLSRDLDQVARPGQLGPGFWPRLALGGLALAGAADVPGARPGDAVHLESFTVNQSLTATDCTVDVGTKTDVGCNTLQEKDDVVLAFKATRIEQVLLSPDP